jgi:hypothetical protein
MEPFLKSDAFSDNERVFHLLLIPLQVIGVKGFEGGGKLCQ